jgi:predicted ester cyclase
MGIIENKAVIRNFVEQIQNRGNVDVSEHLLTEDFVLHFPNLPDIEGIEAFNDIPAAIRTAFPDLVETIEELVAEGDHVVERFTLRGTHLGQFMGLAPTGKPVSWTAIAIYRLDQQRIAECWVEANLQRLLLQVGVVSAPSGLLPGHTDDISTAPLRSRPGPETPTGGPGATVPEPTSVATRWVEAMTSHDLEAAVDCFDPEYEDTAPARIGERVHGQDGVRRNFAALFADIPNLRAELLGAVNAGDTVWMEWRMYGTRLDQSPFEFVGVNIFEVRNNRLHRGRIYSELVRDVGNIDAQIERMTKGTD